MRKIILGLAVVAMAATTSAFTTSFNNKNPNEFEFINVTGVQSTDPLDYEYRATVNCQLSSQACSAMWEHSNTPAIGENPNGPKVSLIDSEGTAEK